MVKMTSFKQYFKKTPKNLKQNCAQAEDYKELLGLAQFWLFFSF